MPTRAMAQSTTFCASEDWVVDDGFGVVGGAVVVGVGVATGVEEGGRDDVAGAVVDGALVVVTGGRGGVGVWVARAI